MIILSIGMLLIVVGAVSISFSDLCCALKLNDESQWKTLGAPVGISFADLGKTIGVYSWVLGFGYEQSHNAEIVNLGKAALKKALFAKYTMMWGCIFVVLGFFLGLFGG
ncbi:hypothetical protein [Cellvibrio sp. PSBB006]|uniref:hypothetical protein n=1 Tax=Cellvibrio sp. PSBB006 TaxID=1987723 RepID=UPI000B3BA2A9|nr:hypothetical protein [Cellvibrio sp. PSBB006]ARU29222.1 hypothetical protein CBR65_18275 [Cellvibrio sp. PSBB006]